MISFAFRTRAFAGKVMTVTTLFSKCVDTILKSIDLVGKASTYLPKSIAYYVLFQACSLKSFRAVEAIVRSWPHPEISFDFMSNIFCRKIKEGSGFCIEAHEYYNIFSTDQYSDCIPSIALGVFNNLFDNINPTLVLVDLSRIRVTELSKVHLLCKLIGGEFPVVHPSDYINSADQKAFSISKPKLPNYRSRRAVMKLNIKISSQEALTVLSEVVPSSAHFEVVYSGIEIYSSCIRKKLVLKALKYFDSVLLNDVFLNPSLVDVEISNRLPGIAPGGTLWFNTSSNLSSTSYAEFLHTFSSASTPIKLVITHLDCNFLTALMASKTILIDSFSVLANQPLRQTILKSREMFGKFLHTNFKVLRYLQLRWYPLTALPLECLQKCTNLRVLSLTMNTETMLTYRDLKYSAIQIFEALQHLQSLEYFEWSEVLNLVTKDLISLKNLLSHHLPELLHWHMRLSLLLLSTTNLHDPEFESVGELLTPLLIGKTESTWCTTYKFAVGNVHFKNWLKDIRPLVCVNCGSNQQVSLLQFNITVD